MDILTPSSGDDPGSFDHLLGRNTTDTINSAEHWQAMIPPAPDFFRGESDAVEVSPPIWRYCPAGWDDQIIGMCVGKATKNGCATLIRIPKGATWDPARPDEISAPLKSVQLSGLYCYWNARNTHGRSGFGEGAVVAYSLDGLKKFGFVTDELYPDSEANQRAYGDGRPPTQAMREFGLKHIIPEAYARRITSRQQLMDYLAQGFPVVDGVPIGSGWMKTAEDGRFSLGGRTVGGHATLKVGYDKRQNRIYTRNSWAGARWGAVTDSPEFADRSGGRNNVGYCPLDEYLDRYYSDRDLQSGQTDAFVLNDVPWDDRTPVEPKIKLLSSLEIFG